MVAVNKDYAAFCEVAFQFLVDLEKSHGAELKRVSECFSASKKPSDWDCQAIAAVLAGCMTEFRRRGAFTDA
jgi:hypothetical protein